MRHSAAIVLLLVCAAAQAQLVGDKEWREADVPQPPPLKTTNLVPLELPGSSLRWGVDPASSSIGADSVVRYVIVAAGEGGAVTGLYEGVRCDTGEVKQYMRHSGGKWQPAGGDWKPLHGRAAARHSLLVARYGACIGHAPNSSADRVARDLAADFGNRFQKEVR